MLNPIDIEGFIAGISQNRFKAYLKESGNEKQQAYALYCYNLKLSQSLYILLNTWEIVLRNAIDAELIKIYGNNWMSNEKFLRHLSANARMRLIEVLNKNASKENTPNQDRVIAELSLSFWVNLLAKKYWKYFGFYPSHWAKTFEKKNIMPNDFHEVCVVVLLLRNRIAHYELIFLDKDLSKLYDKTLAFIDVFSPANGQHVRNICHFKEVLKQKPSNLSEKIPYLPLQGLTVIALEQAVAAPFASSRLADAGARVIKIERPEGDFARGYDTAAKGQSSYFVWLNRGKESLVLDMTKEQAAFATLLETADVLIQNLKPGALARLGFSFEALREKYPRLIICSISGYGETGEMANRKAYDLLIQAESGLASLTGSAAEPSRVGISVVDIATGATAHAAILEALIQRGITGQGADIRLSMFDVMADWLTVPLLNHEAGKTPQRLGLAHPSITPYGVFITKDEKQMLISIQSEREWVSFCEVFMQDKALLEDVRLKTNVLRVKNRAYTDGLVAQKFSTLNENEAKTFLTKADIAFASVNDLEGLSHHPHLRRIGVETPNGVVSYPAPAVIVKDAPRHYKKVPAIGEAQGDAQK